MSGFIGDMASFFYGEKERYIADGKEKGDFGVKLRPEENEGGKGWRD
jgi:hypothetical protein